MLVVSQRLTFEACQISIVTAKGLRLLLKMLIVRVSVLYPFVLDRNLWHKKWYQIEGYHVRLDDVISTD